VQRALQRRSGFGVLVEKADACGRPPAAHGAQDGAGDRIAGSRLVVFGRAISVLDLGLDDTSGAGLPYRRSA